MANCVAEMKIIMYIKITGCSCCYIMKQRIELLRFVSKLVQDYALQHVDSKNMLSISYGDEIKKFRYFDFKMFIILA